MDNTPFGNLDAESLRIKAQETINSKKEIAKSFKQDWSDENVWREMASKLGFRLAPFYAHSSERKYLNRILKVVNRDYDWWKDNFDTSLNEWCRKNENVPAWVMQGLVMECYFSEIGEIIDD